ncbi:MAG: hypothetical protein LQ341_001561 [Variospora aurantia]|nr:MAG: hypothetical protein LQ341_001561 [Variospora aurantia]
MQVPTRFRLNLLERNQAQALSQRSGQAGAPEEPPTKMKPQTAIQLVTSKQVEHVKVSTLTSFIFSLPTTRLDLIYGYSHLSSVSRKIHGLGGAAIAKMPSAEEANLYEVNNSVINAGIPVCWLAIIALIARVLARRMVKYPLDASDYTVLLGWAFAWASCAGLFAGEA